MVLRLKAWESKSLPNLVRSVSFVLSVDAFSHILGFVAEAETLRFAFRCNYCRDL